MRIALAGNPNSGKTTLYNVLTGKNEHAGNWAGVTVDKKEAYIRNNFSNGMELLAVDLPGAYSMSPFTSEETVTSDYIKEENPEVIINIVDATNLSRSLFFTTQLLELGVPVVVALNKSDVNEKKNTVIDMDALSRQLGCPVVATCATAGEGMDILCAKVIEVSGRGQIAPYQQGNVDMSSKAAVKSADKKRFAFVNATVAKVEKRQVLTSQKNAQDQIDAVLANKFFGIPIFAVVMFAVFQLSQGTVGPKISEWLVAQLEVLQGMLAGIVESAGASAFMEALLIDGVVGGVIAVLGFLPLVMVMYFLIALLEDCGYMARVAVVMDPFFKKVGLSGKSIIPMVIGTGCAIPGVMASRTIRNERERRTTAMLAPFMPCGAKLPVIGLFSAAFFSNATWVGTLMYFCGILFVLLGATLTLKITGTKVKNSYFIMELPEYKVPSLWRAFVSMLDRAKDFIIKAGTIILVCNAAIQIMQTFTPALKIANDTGSDSILALIAHPFALLFIPLGFGAWQLAAAAVTGFIAKENVVGTLAVCFAMTNFINEDLEVVGGQTEIAAIMGLTQVAALAYLMFNLFTPPCFAAIGAMNAEMKSAKWLWGGIGLQFATGYVVAFLVYQIGTVITTGAVGTGFVYGCILVAGIVAIIGCLIYQANEKVAVKA